MIWHAFLRLIDKIDERRAAADGFDADGTHSRTAVEERRTVAPAAPRMLKSVSAACRWSAEILAGAYPSGAGF